MWLSDSCGGEAVESAYVPAVRFDQRFFTLTDAMTTVDECVAFLWSRIKLDNPGVILRLDQWGCVMGLVEITPDMVRRNKPKPKEY